ncbi:MAG: decarboxylating 6-phosphogluconate dehydrogenase [Actinobacteria bacterium]|nr:decarboxylating 6-phosphogluconate dehydrogenase [Actinomycetota bacterium]
MVGLGRMGANLVRRISDAQFLCTVFDVDQGVSQSLANENTAQISSADSLAQLIEKLPSPRTIWVMVPAGAPTEKVIGELITLMDTGDIIIDGGNSYYRDDLDHAAQARAKGIHFVDVGTSGGVWGRERGYCLMIGGDDSAVSALEPIWNAVAPGFDVAARTPGRTGETVSEERGWLHCGPPGAGHFVKMVHNGIEYGLMAAYAEGFNILAHANEGTKIRANDAETSPLAHPEHYEYDFDLAAISELWRRGSVVSSWLLDLTASALHESPKLDEFSGQVSDSGEGRWTAIAAIEEGVPAPVLSAALYSRFESRNNADFANKILSAMRKQFGGHQEKKQ